MGDLSDIGIKDVAAFSQYLALLSADAVVSTRPWNRRNEPANGPFALTRCTLGPGNWLVGAQSSFQVDAAGTIKLSIALAISGFGKDKSTPRYTRETYLDLPGLYFGTATVLGALSIDEPVSLELTYKTAGTITCRSKDPLLVALKVPTIQALT